MIKELTEFWKNVPGVKETDMYIDADALKALAIYILIQTKCSKLLVDILIAEEFTPEALKYTNRAYYLTVLHSAFEYIEEKNIYTLKIFLYFFIIFFNFLNENKN